MRSYRKTFGANRFVAAGFLIFFGALAVSIFVPGVTDYVANGNFVGRLRMFNAWEPEQRLLLAYVFAGVMALSAAMFLRMLIDNTMVVVDREGIEVRHPLWVHRALWRDFDTITTTGFLGAKDVKIRFQPGQDARGRKMSRKVRLPSPILGVSTNAVLVEVLMLSIVKDITSPPASTSTRGPGAAPAVGATRPVFGRRQ